MCYMRHRRFLPDDHKYNRSKKAFNEETKMRTTPKLLYEVQLLDQMKGLNSTFEEHPDTK